MRWALVIAAGTMLPYLLAWSLTLQPRYQGWHYTWFIYNPDEPNVHLSWARQVADGKFFQADLFTTESQTPTFFNLFCSLLGVLARVTPLPLIFWYHAVRFISAGGLLVSIYLLAACLSRKRAVRQATFWLAAFSSGFGWLAPFLNPLLSSLRLPAFSPVDVNPGLMMPEANTFLSLLLYPLFTFSMCLLVGAFIFALIAMDTGEVRWAVCAGLCGLALGNVHTYDVFVVYAVLTVWWLGSLRSSDFSRSVQRLKLLLLVVTLSLPSVVYQWWTFQHNPIFRDKALTPTATPLLKDMLFSYGLIALLAAVGGWMGWKRRRQGARFALVWAVLNLLIVYAPVSFQRKMTEGLHIPLCLLAAIGLMECLVPLVARKRVKSLRQVRKAALALAILLTVPSQLAFLRMAMEWVVENNAPRWGAMQPPYYLNEEEWQAMRWLKERVPDGQAVLCSPHLGSHIPALTGKFVYIGHWAETLRFAEKLGTTRRFFARAMHPDEMRNWLTEHRIGFVVADRYAQSLAGHVWEPPPFMRAVFRRGETVVYQASP